MTQSHVTLTDAQKVAVVDRAIALMTDGSTQNAATKQAGAEFGVSQISVRRYATKQGRPLSALTDEVAREKTERAVTLHRDYGLAEQREIAMILVDAIHARARTLHKQAQDEDAPPDLDLRLQRSVVALREATELEHALHMRGATPRPDEQAPAAPEGERPGNVSSIEESRAAMAEMEAANA